MESKTSLHSQQSELNGSLSPLPPSSSEASDTPDEGLDSLFTLLRRRILTITSVTIAVSALAFVAGMRQPVEYEGKFRLLVESVTTNVQENSPSNTDTDKLSTGLDYETQIEVLSSPKLLQPILERIQTKYPDMTYVSLNANLRLSQPEETKIIEVTYKDADPDKVKWVLESLSNGYLKYSQRERQTNLGQGIRFVNAQVNQTQARVDSLQRQLQTFRQRNNFIDPDTQKEQIASQKKDLAQQSLDIQKQIAQTQQQFDNLRARSGAVASLANDANYQKVLDRVRELDSKIAIESTRFQPGEDTLVALQEQRASLMPVLQQEARRVIGGRLADVSNQLSVLTNQQAAIAQAEAYWSQETQRLPVTTRLYTDLQRELTVATESLARFLETREKLQVESAQKEVPWQLIAPPTVPQSPQNPKIRMLVMGAIAGLLLGIAAAMLTQRLDKTFLSIEDLKKQSKLPLLGVIPVAPELKQPNSLLVRLPFQQRSQNQPSYGDYQGLNSFSDAFRSLYTNLRLLPADQAIRSVVISSAAPGDGKSTVAMHLALAGARMGQRVLLVDADLRNPQVRSRLELPNEHGLTEILTANLNPQQVIQRLPSLVPAGNAPTSSSDDVDNLYIVTAGAIPPEPTRLLASRRMQKLCEYFETVFDLVIYDAPPLLNLADSSLLARHADGIVLVAAMGQTRRSQFTQVLENLRTSRIRVWGVVANQDQTEL